MAGRYSLVVLIRNRINGHGIGPVLANPASENKVFQRGVLMEYTMVADVIAATAV
jgi:hypothetical protein